MGEEVSPQPMMIRTRDLGWGRVSCLGGCTGRGQPQLATRLRPQRWAAAETAARRRLEAEWEAGRAALEGRADGAGAAARLAAAEARGRRAAEDAEQRGRAVLPLLWALQGAEREERATLVGVSVAEVDVPGWPCCQGPL